MDKKLVSDAYYNANRAEMLQYIGRSGISALDIGCGTGNFGAAVARERNAEVWGIEINQEVAEVAATSLHTVLCGDATELIQTLPDDYFDIICFNDSLEHLPRPDEILRSCQPKLKDEGEILCSVPNLRYFRVMFDLVFKKQFEYADAGILDRTHLRFFTMESIKNLFMNCGYDIVVLQGNQTRSGARSKSWRYKIFQIITLGRAEDMRHSQIFILAKSRATE